MNKKSGGILVLIFCIMISCIGCSQFTVGSDDKDGSYADKFKCIDVKLTEEFYGIGVDKDDPELFAKVNEFIAQIKSDGTYDEILNHYFGDGKPVQVVSAEKDPSKDQLVIVTTLEFEPFEYGTASEMYGIDFEIAKALADYLDKELVLEIVNFEMMFMTVKQHRADLCIGGITINDARREYVDFSDPYYAVGQNLVVPATNTEFDGVQDAAEVERILKQKDDNTVIAVESQTVSQYYCEGSAEYGYNGFPVSIKYCKNINDQFDRLNSGEADYLIADNVSIQYLLNTFDGGSR